VIRNGQGSLRHSSSTRRPIALRRGMVHDADGCQRAWQRQT
jgi:hypothetical protein